ncbi:MAG: hypothetical protein ACE5FQ_06235 [Thiogranum sp.]
MFKHPRWVMLLPGLLHTLPTPAILLDCKQNKDGTYLCVEIEGARETEAATGQVPEIDSTRIEQARKECVYRRPRTRKGSGSAVRAEARKSAQKDYERCVADRAWELRNQENLSGGTE